MKKTTKRKNTNPYSLKGLQPAKPDRSPPLEIALTALEAAAEEWIMVTRKPAKNHVHLSYHGSASVLAAAQMLEYAVGQFEIQARRNNPNEKTHHRH